MGDGKRGSRARLVILVVAAVLAVEAAVFGGIMAYRSVASAQAESAHVTPALGDSLAEANAAATGHASDAKLLAIDGICSDGECSWTYFYVSRVKGVAFTVAVSGDSAEIAPYTRTCPTQEDMDAIPGVDGLAIDADEAYSKACAALPADASRIPSDIALVTYDMQADDPAADTMRWEFSFDDGSGSSMAYAVDADTGIAERIS